MPRGVHSWERSVEIAKTALLKTFEGRMTVAKESLVQVPHGPGRPTRGARTLGDFAEDVGLQRQTLVEYRRVYLWLDNERPTPLISSYTLVREALFAQRWDTGREFMEFLLRAEPPTWEQEGYEPHTFRSWTVDALRVYLGNRPTNTTLVALRAEAEDREPTHDEEAVAQVADQAEEIQHIAEEIDDPRSSRRALEAVTEAAAAVEEHHDENVNRDLDRMTGSEPSEPMDMAALRAALGRDDLIHEIARLGVALRRRLAEVPEWLEQYGHRAPRYAPEETLGVLMVDTLAEERAQIDMAFTQATGDIAEQFDEFLAQQR